MKVRKATADDEFPILMLAYNFLQEANPLYRGLDHGKSGDIIRSLIESESGLIVVVEDDNERIIGFLAAAIGEMVFNTTKYATELAWYMDKEHRGSSAAIRMTKMYEDWAKETGVSIVFMGDMTETGSLEGMYNRLGYTKVESAYVKEV